MTQATFLSAETASTAAAVTERAQADVSTAIRLAGNLTQLNATAIQHHSSQC